MLLSLQRSRREYPRGILVKISHSLSMGSPNDVAAIRRPDRSLINPRIEGETLPHPARQIEQVNIKILRLWVPTPDRKMLVIAGKPGRKIVSRRADGIQLFARAINPGELLIHRALDQNQHAIG